jgi:hypothetical protein
LTGLASLLGSAWEASNLPIVEECVLHADIVFIINSIVMNMFLALKDIGVFVLDGEPAHGQ